MFGDAGFTTVVVRGHSRSITSMMRLLFLLDFMSSIFVSLVELKQYSIDDMAGNSYRGWEYQRYLAILATESEHSIEVAR